MAPLLLLHKARIQAYKPEDRTFCKITSLALFEAIRDVKISLSLQGGGPPPRVPNVRLPFKVALLKIPQLTIEKANKLFRTSMRVMPTLLSTDLS